MVKAAASAAAAGDSGGGMGAQTLLNTWAVLFPFYFLFLFTGSALHIH